uniref:Antimicrobial peptide type 2 IIc n=1 Tax=Pandalus japonicus TaxID=666362 RepID=T1W2K4_PANJP|nr:antimicrobial peptide type 2 precursor IIc [Pandalus japonicus]
MKGLSVFLMICSMALASVVLAATPNRNNGFGGGLGPRPTQATCRYWCRTPEGQAYCCEGSQEPAGPVGVKPGVCPPVRPTCPPVRSFGPPKTCSNDYSCGGINKCCYDRCLEEHVCKAPIDYETPIDY